MHLHRAAQAAALLAIAGAVALGAHLRLEDPLSSPVIPAEDPYTHMALVREHLRDGELDPLYDGGALYPPGLHALLAAAWTYTGAGLHQIILLGPVFLGAIGVLGAAALLARQDGAAAAVVGATAMAVGPELVFRTTMMAPTALDLALVPFLLFSLVRLVRGRLAWLAAALPLTLHLTFAHPWLLAILTAAGAVFLVFALLLRWRHGPPLSLRGSIAAAGLLSLGTGLATTGCKGMCGPGILRITEDHTMGEALVPHDRALGLVLVLLGLALMAAAMVARRRLEAWQKRLQQRPALPGWTPWAVSAALVAGLVAVSLPAFDRGLPTHVDLSYMFGRPLLALAVVGLAALPWLRSPVAQAGAALAVVTYPFVVHNPFDSPFWPHRTAVYLGLALVVLAGALAGALVRWAAPALARWSARPSGAPGHAASAVSTGILASLVTLLLAGAVVAQSPDKHPWYRLFPDCEAEALRDLGEEAGTDDLIVTGSWQSKLVIAGYAPDASRVWFMQGAFTEGGQEDLGWIAKDGNNVYVVVDRHLVKNDPTAPAALGGPAWQQMDRHCGPGVGTGGVAVYRLDVDRLET